ncbi:hypothetical protein WMY93_030947 [Mugilogobius chulae]|uniref:Uncharacterized protein n=1 Tax=Mugilogobius chulae TaxID=88201 RepID=A0AAW0MEW3_9GOBI
MRHLRTTHPTLLMDAVSSAPPAAGPSSSGINSGANGTTNQARYNWLDELLVKMVARDLMPISIVEDEGFGWFVRGLDPAYVLPSRKALKKRISDVYDETKEKTKAELEKASSIIRAKRSCGSCTGEPGS